ncbi:short-chain dehydrogenase/reductase family 16C member 6-like [Agrilus planipennis]|uniref:Short-chain dehydrogenase/reductase 3 n=1 Tax=Agrilus planipennis TaxID=224129 RepID=A0A1W4WGR3_AGRPL|nr:short-chain dehydrogenase/reductase family 16C member 6-like [Agrilus planipennis]
MSGETKEVINKKSSSKIVLEVLQIIAESLLLILKIFFYIGESLYKILVPPTLKEVKGKVVLITGTGHGIGRELALLYAAEGATVVGWDLNDKGNKETQEEIVQNKYQKCYFYKCDVSDREQVFRTAKAMRKEVGKVDILINNAGIMPCHALLDHTPDEIDRIFKVNVYAHIWTIEAFLPDMMKNNEGHIVALSSCAGLFGIRNLAPYCASKFAVAGLMESLFEELHSNPNNRIQLTTLFPYMTNTGLCRKPKIKFENAMPMLVPSELAKEIMKAQRSDQFEVGVPNYLTTVNNYARLLPRNAQIAVQDFFNTYVEADL